MKRTILIISFSLTIITSVFCGDKKLKADIKAAYPIDFIGHHYDYYPVSPAFEIKFDLPIYKNLGLNFSAEGLFGNFISKDVYTTIKFGDYQFYSMFAGAFYSINLNNDFSLIPSLQAGFSYATLYFEPENQKFQQTYFSAVASVEIEKQLTDNFALYVVTSFGYCDFFCPLALGVGAACLF